MQAGPGFSARLRHLAFFLILAAGCVQEVAIMTYLPPPPSEAVPIPLKVGLSLDPAFQEYVYVGRNYRLPLGESLSEALKTYLATLFAHVPITGNRDKRVPYGASNPK